MLEDDSIENKSKKAIPFKFKKDMKSSRISVNDPGLYTFRGVSTQYCEGEVTEPSSCLLENPFKPSVSIETTEINHKCANSPIGLRVMLDFQGTPPFKIYWTTENTDTRVTTQHSHDFNSHRGQIELIPRDAGHYKHRFIQLMDSYYDDIYLRQELEQDVRPSASASISAGPSKNICLGQTTSFSVSLGGEAPWTLEYEIIHGK